MNWDNIYRSISMRYVGGYQDVNVHRWLERGELLINTSASENKSTKIESLRGFCIAADLKSTPKMTLKNCAISFI